MKFSTETDRAEAFTDRVLAVIITIMVLGFSPRYQRSRRTC